MERKSISNLLELAFSPLSNYEFTILRDDPLVQQALQDSSLYIIVHRPELWFDSVTFDMDKETLHFQIKQHNNPNSLICSVPINQEAVVTEEFESLIFELGPNIHGEIVNEFPAMGVPGIKIYRNEVKEDNFLTWLSPEKFLFGYWDKYINADVTGDIRAFTRYKVHYVGKATEQEVWKRLTGHSALQNILSLEAPFKYGSLPTNEIALLLFTFQDNLEIRTYGPGSSLDTFLENTPPDRRAIFLDAEKALIKAIQPKYNGELFKNYPKSADGLFKQNYNAITYSFVDPITLVYDKGEIEGRQHFLGGDFIYVKDNKTMELIKHNPDESE